MSERREGSAVSEMGGCWVGKLSEKGEVSETDKMSERFSLSECRGERFGGAGIGAKGRSCLSIFRLEERLA